MKRCALAFVVVFATAGVASSAAAQTGCTEHCYCPPSSASGAVAGSVAATGNTLTLDVDALYGGAIGTDPAPAVGEPFEIDSTFDAVNVGDRLLVVYDGSTEVRRLAINGGQLTCGDVTVSEADAASAVVGFDCVSDSTALGVPESQPCSGAAETDGGGGCAVAAPFGRPEAPGLIACLLAAAALMARRRRA